MKKKLISAILAGMMAFSVAFTTQTQAATRDEIADIKVSKSGNFNYWEKNSAVKQQLVNYVKDVTNKKSKNFIPFEDRIAVFDMDGTILCETAPYYFNGMMFIHRALYDQNYTSSAADREFAKAYELKARKKANPKLGLSEKHKASVFKGMSDKDYTDYVKNFMQTPVEGLTNLKWGEAFYLPMVEVIKYLQANDFKVYIVSGTERGIVRALACDVLNIPTYQIIGSESAILAAHQGNTDGLKYVYRADDYLVYGDFVFKTTDMNKVSAIAQEIGKQPVLAFGNSSGDASMLNYTISGNKYKSLSFLLLCDDLTRELGDTAKADKCKALADKNGWISVSMKDDFKTIYGDNVKREN